MPTINMAETGQNIARIRKEKGMTIRDLQEIFGFSTPQALYKWEKGSAMPTVDNLVILAAVFGCRIDDILIVNFPKPNGKTA